MKTLKTDHLRTTPARIAIVGSRTFNDFRLMADKLNAILRYQKVEYILSGGARGADSLARVYAQRAGLNFRLFPADWDKHGKKAGFLRNYQMLEDCTHVVAFLDSRNSSPGTQHMIEIAVEGQKPIRIIKF